MYIQQQINVSGFTLISVEYNAIVVAAATRHFFIIQTNIGY